MLKKRAIKSLLRNWKKGGFSIVYWDGETEEFGEELSAFKLVFKKEPRLHILKEDPSLVFGKAYMNDEITIEGSMNDVLRVISLNTEPKKRKKHLLPVNNKTEQKNIQHHYDLGNDFFSLWLDKTMSYSCAYFQTPGDSLEQAQLQKIDLVLKKLKLKEGETLLDIGSGWGWLIIRAAQQYGVQATGITLSQEQYLATKAKISNLGLTGQVEVLLSNYQELCPSQYQFDKISSVGMIEHVGRHHLPLYMEKVSELLRPGGLFLLHSITGMTEGAGNAWIKKYIFPGGCIPSLRELIGLLPENDFHLLHAESLRLHYALTLDRWYENFLAQKEVIRHNYEERFIRMWRLYLTSCAASFRTSGLDIHQLLCSKGLNNQYQSPFL